MKITIGIIAGIVLEKSAADALEISHSLKSQKIDNLARERRIGLGVKSGEDYRGQSIYRRT